MHSEAVAVLALLMAPGAGNVTVNQALTSARRCGLSLGELLAMPARDMVEALPPGSGDASYFLSRCSAESLEHAARLVDRAARSGAQAIVTGNGDYPESLQPCLGSSAPPVLFVAGDIDLLAERCVGIVGARYASEGGLLLAAECAQVFANAGVPVVSGGAKGVDSAAHGAALANGGSTVVVLAEGLLRWKGPADVMEAAEEGRAAMVSEFAPEAAWSTHAAVTRNATISALSSMLCVIEPRKEGGSIRTARCGLDQGKRVLVHAARDDATAATGLCKRGALPLVGDGSFDAERLAGYWESAGEAGPAQQDLF